MHQEKMGIHSSSMLLKISVTVYIGCCYMDIQILTRMFIYIILSKYVFLYIYISPTFYLFLQLIHLKNIDNDAN